MTQNNPMPPDSSSPPAPILPYSVPGLTETGQVCPKCHGPRYKAVSFTWWGGALGPRLFSHVKCLDCGAGFNKKTGKSNNAAIAIYLTVTTAIGLIIAILWIMSR